MIYTNIKYIDPTIVTAGDGSSASTALKTFPACNEIPDSTLYIIRRTTTALEITDNNSYESTQTNTTCKRLGIVGMPAVGTVEYELVSADVKTAWDADADIRPVVKAADMCHWQMNELYDLEIKNIEMQHGMMSSDYYEMNTMINCSKDNRNELTKRYGVFTLSNCVLKNFKNWETAIEGCGSFIYFNSVNDINIVNNVFWNSPLNNGMPGGSSGMLSFNKIYHNVLIQNNILHLAASGLGGGPDMGGASTIEGNTCQGATMNECILLNNEMRFWLQQPDEYSGSAPGGIYIGGYADYVYVKGIKAIEEKIVGTPTNITISTPICITPIAKGIGWYEDYQITIPSFRAPGMCNLIYCGSSGDLAERSNQVKNIHISMGTAPLGPIPEEYESSYTDYFALKLSGIVNAESISVHCPEGRALYCNCTKIKAKNIDGVVFAKYSLIEIESNTFNKTNYSAFYLDYSSCVSCDNITVPENYSMDVIKLSGNYTESSTMWVGSCNKPLMLTKGKLKEETESGDNHFDGGGLFISSDGAEGRFSQYGPGYYADTWACARQGSTAPASLRIKSKRTVIQSKAMRTVKNPGSLLFKNGVAAGNHKVTIYFASSEIADLPEKIKFELETDNGIYKSDVCGRIVETADKWIGAGTVKSYNCIINVNCTGTCSITGSLTTIFFGELGTIFLDPVITVE